MRPANLNTKIFLDSGDPAETKEAIKLLGFLDGQTTNPTLIAKNPEAQERLEKGEKFSAQEIFDFYKVVVEEISTSIPQGSVSVEVYADQNTTTEEMIKQGQELFSWIPNAHIKLPIIDQGLRAAEQVVKAGVKVNMTLCFSQEQAAAVQVACQAAVKGDVFVSPFVGRLDDQGKNGMDLIANIIKMYQAAGGQVEVLTASVRTYDHFQYALKLGSDIITAPFKILKEWSEKGLEMPANDWQYDSDDLAPIPYQDLDLKKYWTDYNIKHELTDTGLQKFSDDWNALIK